MIDKKIKQLIDRNPQISFGGGRGNKKTLLSLELNILTHLRLRGFNWNQIESGIGDKND